MSNRQSPPLRPARSPMGSLLSALLWATLLALPVQLSAATATVAVAANFKATLITLTAAFEQQSPHRLRLVSSSTGVLYNQILHGAPFDLLLAADSEHPLLLERNKIGVEGSRFSYASGALALVFATQPVASKASAERTEQTFIDKLSGSSGKIALANPALAPYGLASRQVLEYLGLSQSLQSRLVMGSNVAQSHQFVATGNSPLGFVALAQAYAASPGLAYWPVPANWHQPIQQQAILLQSGYNNQAAVDFHRFLSSATAVAIITSDGYQAAIATTDRGQ